MGSIFTRGAFAIMALAFLLATFTRLTLLFVARQELGWDASLLGALATGVLFDLVTALYCTGLWWLLAWCIPSARRQRARRIVLVGILTLFWLGLGFTAVAEYFFWDEFQTRFNFIAVDYLIWTQEVWGNIRESYPMPAILAGLACVAALGVTLMYKLGVLRWIEAGTDGWKPRLTATAVALALIATSAGLARQSWHPKFANQYNAELAKNGVFSFGAAFWEMEIDYQRYYRTLPADAAFTRMRSLMTKDSASFIKPEPQELKRRITHHGVEKKWNVMLICMESMNADFMARYGNKKELTPNLDRLVSEGLNFSRLYATGTRTVRGMEALTLGLPPTPGQAILYRPRSEGLQTIGALFSQRGYDCSFIYGGDGRFDYMNRYFAGSGYQVHDKPQWQPTDITFETSWGACDEDAFNVAIRSADRSAAAGRPFHHFIMTTSNHRPFQFPAGRVARASDTGRNAAVQYADYAVGQLIKSAATKPWFKDTLFIFVADHCASSAGRVELDCRRYHIPAIVWNPALVSPQDYGQLCSQIDVMPTVFGLLGWSYDSLFYGHDLLASPATAHRRAFISNYQKIALLTPKHLAILKPKRECSLYDVRLKTGALTANPSLTALEDDAIGYYQTAAWLFSSGALKAFD